MKRHIVLKNSRIEPIFFILPLVQKLHFKKIDGKQFDHNIDGRRGGGARDLSIRVSLGRDRVVRLSHSIGISYDTICAI